MGNVDEAPSCGNAKCASLGDVVWEEMRQRGCSWRLRQTLECEVCARERERRCRVMLPGNVNWNAHLRKPFAEAPYIHPFNAPTYHAQMLRARNFAKASGRRILWSPACDLPVLEEDKHKPRDQWAAEKERFLTLHEKHTAGIPGMQLFIIGMPLRFTDTEDREKGVFKNSKGHLTGGRMGTTI